MRIKKIVSLILAITMSIICIIPIGAAFAAPGGNSITASLPDLTANPSADPTLVTISGTSVQYPGTVVTIMVWLPLASAEDADLSNIRNEAAFAEEVVLDADGSFSTSFNISGNAGSDAPSERYTVNAFIPGMSEPMTTYFDYKNIAAANAVVTAVRGATTVSDVKSALNSGISAVDVASGVSYYSYKSESQRDAVAQHIFETFYQNSTVTENEITAELGRITNALDAIVELTDDTREQMRDNLAKYMAEPYKNLMGFSDEAINTYKNVLTSAQREKAVVYMAGNAKNLVLPSDLTALFAKALEEAVKNDTASNYTPIGGGGGGGGGNGFAVDSSAMPEAPEENSSTGLDAFEDIESVAWAKNAINILSAKGVIKGRSEREFAPNDAILREEMVKLLIEGFGITSSTGKLLPFNDVMPTDWHYEYIVRAYTENITAGISATEFGVGSAITRQDMAVLIVNTLKCAGFVPEASAEEFVFADDESIADYARDAVYTLAKSGLINGMGDNMFAPDNSATRAEVAVLLYRAMYKFNLI